MKKSLVIFLIAVLAVTSLASADLTIFGRTTGDEIGSPANTIYQIFSGNTNPFIFFEPSPETPSNNSLIGKGHFETNTTIDESSLEKVIYNFNKTNYTLYNDSLVGMWNFDNYTKFNDTSRYENDGHCENKQNPCPHSVEGKYGQAYKFDANEDDSIKTSLNAKVLDENIATFTGWVKPQNDGGYIEGPTKQTVGGNYRWDIEGDQSESMRFANHGANSGHCSTGANSVPHGEWTHFSVMVNTQNERVKIYINGELNASCQTSPYPLDGDKRIRIGAAYDSSSYEGSIDEVRIWNRSLSEDEVKQHYMSNLRKFNETRWKLEVNQTKNSISNLETGSYIYQSSAEGSAGYRNSTEKRTINIDRTPPFLEFKNPTPSDGKTQTDKNATINISSNDIESSLSNDSLEHSTFLDFNKSLVGWWEMDWSNSTGIYDNSTYNNFGTFNGGLSQANKTDGKRGKGLEFDGRDDYVALSGDDSLDMGTGDVSFGVWVKINSGHTTNWETLVGADDGDSIHGFRVAADYGRWIVGVRDNNDDSARVSSSLTKGEWKHVFGVLNGNNLTLYVNGELKGSSDASAVDDINREAPIYIGANVDASRFLNGSIDSVQIYDRALSETEVKALYNASKHQYQRKFKDLETGTYNYTGYSIDKFANVNSTEQRSLTYKLPEISIENLYPNKSISVEQHEYFNNSFNVTCTENDCGDVNVTNSYFRTGGNIYSASYDDTIHKISPNGSQVWNYTGHSNWVNSVAVDSDGYVYSAAYDTIHKISPNGSQVWNYTQHSNNVDSVAVDSDGYVYSGSYDDTIHKISPNGSQVWNYTQHSDLVKSVAVDSDGYVYSASYDDTIHKISPNGSQVWNYRHSTSFNSVAVDSDGYVYSGSIDNELHKISPNGSQVWNYTGHSNNVNSVAVDSDGYVYSASDDKTIHKISPNGSQVWNYTQHSGDVNSVAVDPYGYVYSGSNDDTIHKISPNGSQVWNYTQHSNKIRSVAVDPGKSGAGFWGAPISTNLTETPFYTNKSSNPYTINLSENESQEVNYWVNATGDLDTYDFFGLAKITKDTTIDDSSSEWNVTIVDTTAPEVNITYPENKTYENNTRNLKYNLNELNPNKCWYSTDGGTTNSTAVNADGNFTGVNSTDGKNTWTVYCNDTSGNVGSDNVTFTRDAPKISIENLYPNKSINAEQNEYFNNSFNVTCTENDCGDVNVSLNEKSQRIENGGWEKGNKQSWNTSRWNVSTSAGSTSAYEGIYMGHSDNNGQHNTVAYAKRNVSLTTSNNLTFWWKVSSEPGYDFGRFYVDGSKKLEKSGENSWEKEEFSLSKGEHELKWEYEKDGSVSSNEDRLYVDNVSLRKNQIKTPTNSTKEPFYTNKSSNPYTINLSENESQEVNYWVNATGDPVNAYKFSGLAKITKDTTIDDSSSEWNVTIVDTKPPEVNITYPENKTYENNTRNLKYNLNELNPNKCWYSTDGGTTNSTAVNADGNFTGVNSTDGKNTWTVYCNDTSGNVGSDNVTFTRDAPKISIENLYPNKSISVEQHEYFNNSFNVTCTGNDCGDVNVSLMGEIPLDIKNGGWEKGNKQSWNTSNWAVSTSTSSTSAYEGTYMGYSNNSGNHNTIAYAKRNVTLDSPKNLTFWWKVSSESGYDFGRFYIDGTQELEKSGANSWEKKEFSLSKGEHELKWEYDKDYSVSRNEDKLFIDNVRIKGKKISKIPTNSTKEPFYTNKSSNPYTINLNENESKEVKYWVNATGDPIFTSEFIGQAKMTNDTTINDSSSKWNVTINTDPEINASFPPNDHTTTNRTPKFNWTASDPEGDTLTYELNITCSPGCSADDRFISGITQKDYVVSNYLGYLSDNGFSYNWSVRAYDGYSYSNWTEERTLNVQSLIQAELPQNTTDFGSLGTGESKNTTNNNPQPLRIENTGNALINSSLNSTPLWQSVSHPSNNYQYQIAENESSSYNPPGSQTTWANVPSITTHAINDLNWTQQQDSADIELYASVPSQETAGDKQSTITITSSLSEEE